MSARISRSTFVCAPVSLKPNCARKGLMSRLSPLVFLVLYGLFFAAMGVNQLAYNTIQGKLIRPTRRGQCWRCGRSRGE